MNTLRPKFFQLLPYILSVGDWIAHILKVIWELTDTGGQGRNRTYSSRGNGFTVRRDSPTSPLAQKLYTTDNIMYYHVYKVFSNSIQNGALRLHAYLQTHRTLYNNLRSLLLPTSTRPLASILVCLQHRRF
jgi:hypothetical protein